MCICGWLLEFVCTTCMLGSMEAEKDNWISWNWCFRTPCPLQNQQSTCPPSICPALSLRFCFVFVFKLKESIFIDFDFIPCLNKGFKFKFLSLMPFLFLFSISFPPTYKHAVSCIQKNELDLVAHSFNSSFWSSRLPWSVPG